MGNGITQAFNWMGLTFAVEGVAAFVSVPRHDLLPYACMHHAPLTQEAAALSLRNENSQSHLTEFSLTFHLMGNLWTHREAARKKKSISANI